MELLYAVLSALVPATPVEPVAQAVGNLRIACSTLFVVVEASGVFPYALQCDAELEVQQRMEEVQRMLASLGNK
jgi:hypothetical protein